MKIFPDVWGEGSIFAFSGFDGKTDWTYPFVGTLLENRIGFTIRTEREKNFWISLRQGNKIAEIIKRKNQHCFDHFSTDIVAGDIISLRCGFKNTKIRVLALPLSKNKINVSITPETISKETFVYFSIRIDACKKLSYNGNEFVIKTDKDITFLILNKRVDDYNVVDSMEEVSKVISGKAKKRAKQWNGDKEVRYLVICRSIEKSKRLNITITTSRKHKSDTTKIKDITTGRKDFYITRVKGIGDQTLAKAFSILKANVESPQGVFKQRWTTPDRWPHRHLWLWDSCFHSIAYSFIDKKLAEDSIVSVLDTQQKNGFVPHIGRPNGDFSNITQPPLLSWAVLKVYHYTKNRRFLIRTYPKLRAYLSWCLKSRDRNRNGLLEWVRSDESGMDNSSRFNYGCDFDAIDFSSLLVNDLSCLYKIGKEIGKPDEKLKKNANRISKKIEEFLWNRKKEFFFDRYFDKRFSIYKTICGFLPLLSESANINQAEKLVYHLENRNDLNTPFPVPSEAIDSPTFDNNMWRGPVWLNYNYFIIEGLKNYGFTDLAEKIRKKTIKEVEKWYHEEGTIFEFYDPFGKTSPRNIPRKDKYGAIKEFGWSAAMYILLTIGQQE